MGYLIGQLGGLLPIPGGLGGIDGGLIGTLIVYGAPAAATVAAVLAYRAILFWLPLMVGGLGFSCRSGATCQAAVSSPPARRRSPRSPLEKRSTKGLPPCPGGFDARGPGPLVRLAQLQLVLEPGVAGGADALVDGLGPVVVERRLPDEDGGTMLAGSVGARPDQGVGGALAARLGGDVPGPPSRRFAPPAGWTTSSRRSRRRSGRPRPRGPPAACRRRPAWRSAPGPSRSGRRRRARPRRSRNSRAAMAAARAGRSRLPSRSPLPQYAN